MPEAVADVLRHLSTLPPFPRVTAKLLAMLQDESTSIDELAAVISMDPSLAAKVIHLSNSPFYMVSRQVETVKDSLFVLGINSIKNITTGLSIQKGLNKLQPRAGTFDMTDFWKHSYATAIVATKLGARTDLRLGDMLYLAGLVHDVGKLILACYWPDVWKAVISTYAQSDEPYCEIEARLCPQAHATIAAELLHNWNFPQRIVQMVEHHHSPEESDHATEAGCSYLRIANSLVNSSGYSFPANGRQSPIADCTAYAGLIATLDVELEHQLKVLTGYDETPGASKAAHRRNQNVERG